MRAFFFALSILFSSATFSNELARGLRVSNNENSCREFVSSEVCSKFQGQPGALKPEQCRADVAGENWSLVSRLSNCASGFKLSAKDMWEVAKSAGSGAVSLGADVYEYLSDSNSRAATNESIKDAFKVAGDYLESIYPYIATEFFKAYSESSKEGSSPTMSSLRAANSIAPRLMGKLMSTALEVIKSKYKEFHCFDNNKQVEMICRIAGDILVPPTAILGMMKYGAKGLAATPAVAKKIEEMLKVGVRGINAEQKAEDVAEVVQKVSEHKQEILDRLKELGSRGSHDIRIENGVGVVEIGYLHRSQKAFMAQTTKAIKEGAVQKIDAGNIVGPKVIPTMMDYSKKLNKQGLSVKFEGELGGNRIKTTFEDQVAARAPALNDKGQSNVYHWNNDEIVRYRQAYTEMGIDEACRKYYPNQICGRLFFSFDSKNPKKVIWRKP